MIKSMTAFARTENVFDKITYTIEIRTYNSRHLDVTLRVPYGYDELEEKIKSLVSENLFRGRVEIKLRINDESEEASCFQIDKVRAKALKKSLAEINSEFGIETEFSVESLFGSLKILKTVVPEKDIEKIWGVLSPVFKEVLDNINSMREAEGAHTAKDFLSRLDYIEKSIDEIEEKSTDLPKIYKEKLEARISSLTDGILEIDKNRIGQEAALIADRSDISEEITRSRSHVEQFRKIMSTEENPGRKLNFLLQEFNREFNTMGSKTGSTNVSHMIVDLKSELEKIREQVQNVE